VIEAKSVLEWKHEERLETLRQTLWRLLEAQCGPLPEAVIKKIAATEDVALPDAALLQVLKIERLEDLKW
jgi:hypothetical protein